jgi:hypothetical protein
VEDVFHPLLPDVSLVGYLLGKEFGAIAYNIFHSYILPIVLDVASYFISLPDMTYILLIWIAHIGFDCFLGFGLKMQRVLGIRIWGLSEKQK